MDIPRIEYGPSADGLQEIPAGRVHGRDQILVSRGGRSEPGAGVRDPAADPACRRAPRALRTGGRCLVCWAYRPGA